MFGAERITLPCILRQHLTEIYSFFKWLWSTFWLSWLHCLWSSRPAARTFRVPHVQRYRARNPRTARGEWLRTCVAAVTCVRRLRASCVAASGWLRASVTSSWDVFRGTDITGSPGQMLDTVNQVSTLEEEGVWARGRGWGGFGQTLQDPLTNTVSKEVLWK